MFMDLAKTDIFYAKVSGKNMSRWMIFILKLKVVAKIIYLRVLRYLLSWSKKKLFLIIF